MLAQRGGLSYGQFAKYSLAGKVGIENTALAAIQLVGRVVGWWGGLGVYWRTF